MTNKEIREALEAWRLAKARYDEANKNLNAAWQAICKAEEALMKLAKALDTPPWGG